MCGTSEPVAVPSHELFGLQTVCNVFNTVCCQVFGMLLHEPNTQLVYPTDTYQLLSYHKGAQNGDAGSGRGKVHVCSVVTCENPRY